MYLTFPRICKKFVATVNSMNPPVVPIVPGPYVGVQAMSPCPIVLMAPQIAPVAPQIAPVAPPIPVPELEPAKPAPKKPQKRKLASILGIRRENEDRVGIVKFADSDKSEEIPWEDLKRNHRLEVIKFYEKFIVTRQATEEELRSLKQ